MRQIPKPAVLVAALALGLSLATVYVEYRGLLDLSLGASPRAYIEHDVLAAHRAVLDGVVGDPWRFRLLSDWGAEGFLRLARAVGFDQPGVAGFLTFRVLQNTLIFVLAWLYYRRLGATRAAAALGLGLVAWAMTQSLLHAGLAFNTYGDVVFYLAAALLILDRRYAWIVPLAVLAAVNRETSGLIPVMLVAHALWIGRRTPEGRRALRLGLTALAAFAATYGIVRLAVGPADLILGNGRHPGFEIFEYNVGRGLTWDNLFRTVNILPLLAVAAWRSWPPALRAFGLAIVPAWLLIHVFSGVLAESRLLLVPLVMVFVPGVLAGLDSSDRSATIRTERIEEGEACP
ncbi:MAG TPA: hypothetical protein VF545_10040 [Thermoleophilaceae bacterium]